MAEQVNQIKSHHEVFSEAFGKFVSALISEVEAKGGVVLSVMKDIEEEWGRVMLNIEGVEAFSKSSFESVGQPDVTHEVYTIELRGGNVAIGVYNDTLYLWNRPGDSMIKGVKATVEFRVVAGSNAMSLEIIVIMQG